MRGALKLTFVDGTEEYFEVEPVGGRQDFVDRLKTFVASPNLTLITNSEILVVPSSSIRHISITRADELPLEELDEIPGVLVGVKRLVG
jgi:hypothetical protein